MNEVIENVLSDENITTNEERVEAIKKGLATLVIPKDKYNDLSTRLKTTESNLQTLQTEYDDFKKSKMSEDELKEAKEKEFLEKVRANAIEKSDLAVQKLLLKNGIDIKDDDVELKETLSSIVSEDYERSIKLANSFISLLNKTKDTTAKETTTKLLNDTPKPVGGVDSSSNVSKVEELKKELDKAIKDKDVIKQTSLISEIYREQNKEKV